MEHAYVFQGERAAGRRPKGRSNGHADGMNVSELFISQMACSAFTVSPVLHLQ
jgi:hypothetical protein